MPIQILPPQLANQIAAGEVVERPASIVKELVENALDAGASKIEIDIERGGHKKVLITDNGKGIAKDELSLALSRHATSKISTMDDLEAIVSLGFRGEALASISSVSRLTITSKPKEQDAAWSAIAEGLDMAVDVKPAAHPNGTTVEVLDLFFNTPARRKFLRAEKTEFSHIETLIRRIAISQPSVTFVLKHNQKVVKRYRGHTGSDQQLDNQSARIADVISATFVEDCSVRTAQYDEINISLWVRSPQTCKSVNPAQYAYVNGRMMRDKLLQHAIRQAYANELHSEQQPEYVLFIDLPANDVDVNVHPAKHEVRFHQARLLHDLLVGLIQEALADFGSLPATHSDEAFEPTSWLQADTQSTPTVSSVGRMSNATAATATPTEFPGLKPAQQIANNDITSNDITNRNSEPTRTTNQFGKTSLHAYRVAENSIDNASIGKHNNAATYEFKVVSSQSGFAVVLYADKCWALKLDGFANGVSTTKLSEHDLKPSPLLVPTRLKLSDDEVAKIRLFDDSLRECGFEVKLHQKYLIVKQVPSIIRAKSNGRFIPTLFDKMFELPPIDSFEHAVQALSTIIANPQELALSPEQIIEKLDILSAGPKFAEFWQLNAKEIDPSRYF